ncbi:MAG: hypothetical protein J0I09_09145 [Sphingobacteriia bacterium]|nr:hypothetical protein [Sphingobacteriia bacterium]
MHVIDSILNSIQNTNTTKELVNKIVVLDFYLQILLVLKNIYVEVNRYSGSVEIPDFKFYSENRVGSYGNFTLNYDSLNHKDKREYYYSYASNNFPKDYFSFGRMAKTKIVLLNKNNQHPLLKLSYPFRGKTESLTELSSYYANAANHLDFQHIDINNAYKELEKINKCVLLIDTLDEKTFKTQMTFSKMYNSRDFLYLIGGDAIKKLHAMILTADIEGDSAISTKNTVKLSTVMDKYLTAYKWFAENIKCERAKDLNHFQYQVLNGLFDNLTTVLLLYINESKKDEQSLLMQKKYTESCLNCLLSYIQYSATYFTSEKDYDYSLVQYY